MHSAPADRVAEYWTASSISSPFSDASSAALISTGISEKICKHLYAERLERNVPNSSSFLKASIITIIEWTLKSVSTPASFPSLSFLKSSYIDFTTSPLTVTRRAVQFRFVQQRTRSFRYLITLKMWPSIISEWFGFAKVPVTNILGCLCDKV